jgi:hypothetical protein
LRRALFIRFLISLAAGVLLAIPLSEVGFRIARNNTSRPARTIELTIPANTSTQVSQGNRVLPQDMVFVVGDTLLVHNHDSVAQTLGPLFIPPGSSASLTLNHVGYISLVCSFQPTNYQGLNVTAALTLLTRVEGYFIAGVPIGMLIGLYSLILRPVKVRASSSGTP